jgi:hypothetical protein
MVKILAYNPLSSMKNHIFLSRFKKLSLTFFLSLLLFQCSDEEILSEPTLANDPATSIASVSICTSCTYTVPATANVVDGQKLGIKPGNVICLNAAYAYKNLLFRNIVGTADKPVIIQNCGGIVTVNGTGLSYGIKTETSKFFKITGGSVSQSYGIKITGGQLGLTLDKLSTNFEIDHIEVSKPGFAGIMAKTDPSCDNTTIRGNFTMEDISLHDNYVHDTGGEGFYVGNSFFATGMSTSCGTRMPHEIHNVKIYNNLVKNSGWESIQLGCATQGAEVYNNTVENYGTANEVNQRNGIQIGEGSGGLCNHNFIKTGTGNGIVMLGLGDNLVHDNIIVNAGGYGIFCDERYTPGPGFKFINNTIINPKSDGIRIYADLVPMNVIINNIIVNPGSYSSYTYPRTGNDAYIYKLSSNVKIQLTNNYFTRSISAVKFANAAAFNYRQTSSSPTINKGRSISTYNIPKDFYKQTRLKGTAYDIGASEY